MVIWSEFRMEQYGGDDHREDTSHFKNLHTRQGDNLIVEKSYYQFDYNFWIGFTLLNYIKRTLCNKKRW